MAWNKRPIPDYMETVQTRITPILRSSAVDVVILAAEILQCTPKMLHVAVTNLDRYLSVTDVDMHELLVAAMTCLKMADCLGVRPYAFLCGGMITFSEFLEMELSILRTLNDDVVTVTTAHSFLKRYVRTALRERNAPLQHLDRVAAYLADVSLLSTDMLRFSPSMVAASSVYWAQNLLDRHCERPWSDILTDYTMFEDSDLQDCVLVLVQFLNCNESRLPGINMKYSQRRAQMRGFNVDTSAYF